MAAGVCGDRATKCSVARTTDVMYRRSAPSQYQGLNVGALTPIEPVEKAEPADLSALFVRRHAELVRLALLAQESAEHELIRSEERKQVLAALAALPSRRREVLVLRYYLDLSEAEIASVLGISPGTVKPTPRAGSPRWPEGSVRKHDERRRQAEGRAGGDSEHGSREQPASAGRPVADAATPAAPSRARRGGVSGHGHRGCRRCHRADRSE